MTQLVPLYPAVDLWLEQGTVKAIDIDSGFDDEDFISVALPEFPLSDVNLSTSFIEFTSHPEGNFTAGPTDSVSFDLNENAWVSGDNEFRFQRGLLTTIDKSAMTGVRFTVDASDSGSDFRVLAIRLLSKDWVYPAIDMNTLDGRVVRPVSLDGSVAPTPVAPFDTWPNLFRSDEVPGSADPRPIDSYLVAEFYTGELEGNNQFSIFLRERQVDYQTMLDLDSTNDLDGKPQPDYGEAKYVTRNQKDIDAIADSVEGIGVDDDALIGIGLTQADLDGQPQFDLERKPDLLTAVWIEVRFEFGDTTNQITLWDAETGTPFYTLPMALDDNVRYLAYIDLEDHSLRCRIYTKDEGRTGTLVFDSTLITDSSLFKRRKGRVGWSANFEDGSAFLDSIAPRYLNFAEYRSLPYASITPVVGATLDVGATAPTDLFKGINAGPWGGEIYDNPGRGPESFRIRNTALAPLQGVQTNSIFFDDLGHTEVEFQLYVVQEALDAGTMHLFIWDGLNATPLPMANLVGNTWNDVYVDLSLYANEILPGYYTLVIAQSVIGIPNDWLIDNVTIRRSNIEWAARPYVDDAWNDHEEDWVPYRQSLNHLHGGVLFAERAKKFQVRGKALRQTAKIGQVRAIPKYAELGALNFTDPIWKKFLAGNPPTAGFSTAIDGLTVTFTSTSTHSYRVISELWYFGDGSEDHGRVVEHTYASSGTYPVTVVAMDAQGNRTSYTDDVTV